MLYAMSASYRNSKPHKGECDLESRVHMRLDAEITMLKKRLIRASQYVNCLTHPYMLKISQMVDVRLNEFERIKKVLF